MALANRRSLAILTAAFAAAACKGSSATMDNDLKQDLAAAQTTQSSRITVSPEELGERATPAPVTHAARAVKRAPAPAPKRVVTAQAAAAAPVQQAPAPQPQPQRQVEARVPAPSAPAPRPAPVNGDANDGHHGRYKTEAEIFQKMPWIRP